MLRAEIFGDLITVDHKVLSDESESRNNHRYAVVVQDSATHWFQSFPCKTKSSQETQKNWMRFLEPTRKAKVFYTDNSLEFAKSWEDLSWNHCTSTPHRSETTGIAERAVRRVKEGTSAVVLQSGLDIEWWADFMEWYCYLRNIQDLLSDAKTPYDRRFGMPLNGPLIPFGAIVEYQPISVKDQSRLHQSGAKSLAWYISRLCIIRGRSLERRHYGHRHWILGGDGRIRTPRPDNIHINPGASGPRRRRNSSRKIRWNIFSNPTSRRLNAGWWGSGKWLLDYYTTIHLSSSRGMQSQTVRADWRIISYSIELRLRYQNNIYITRRIVGEKIEDHWNVDGKRELSDTWTGFTRFILFNERPLTDRDKTYEEINNLSSSHCMARNLDHMSDAAKRKQNKDGLSRNQSSTTQDKWEEYSSLNQMMKNSSSQWKPLGESWKFRCQQQCLAKYR